MSWQSFCLIVSALAMASLASCSPAPISLTSSPRSASPTETPLVKPVQSSPAAPTPSPAAQQTAVSLWTAVPITQTEPIETQEAPGMSAVPTPTPLDPTLQIVVAQARDDLAQRLGIAASQIEMVDLQAVTWPDKGLGCPKPGMIYLQVQVDGLLIRLRAGGRLYEYHSGGGVSPFLCEREK